MTKTSGNTQTVIRDEDQTEKPPMYKVVFHNDDYTTMEFVVSVLITIFHHNEAQAFEVMMNIHKAGTGIAGVYTREVAETKAAKCIAVARKNEFPLEVTVEPE
jgi:ATP-dependent Clp protease adaptor protein ClpS